MNCWPWRTPVGPYAGAVKVEAATHCRADTAAATPRGLLCRWRRSCASAPAALFGADDDKTGSVVAELLRHGGKTPRCCRIVHRWGPSVLPGRGGRASDVFLAA